MGELKVLEGNGINKYLGSWVHPKANNMGLIQEWWIPRVPVKVNPIYKKKI